MKRKQTRGGKHGTGNGQHKETGSREDTKQGKMGRNRRNNWESGMEVMLAGRERGKMGLSVWLHTD